MSIPDPKARDPKLAQAHASLTPKNFLMWPTCGSAPAMPMPISISTTTRSIRTSNTSTKTRIPRHVVWFLDGVTLLNEMRAARGLGIQTFALWRLGGEDRTHVEYLGQAQRIPLRLTRSAFFSPGTTSMLQGSGDILRVTGLPQTGKRTVTVDTDEPDPRKKLIIDEHMDVFPHTYTVEYYGYHPNEVAISFDDGPDPKWTPQILDILKRKNVKATFMMIGAEAQENIGLMQRVQREGHEIGNHTFFHPDISEIDTRPPRS